MQRNLGVIPFAHSAGQLYIETFAPDHRTRSKGPKGETRNRPSRAESTLIDWWNVDFCYTFFPFSCSSTHCLHCWGCLHRCSRSFSMSLSMANHRVSVWSKSAGHVQAFVERIGAAAAAPARLHLFIKCWTINRSWKWNLIRHWREGGGGRIQEMDRSINNLVEESPISSSFTGHFSRLCCIPGPSILPGPNRSGL